MILNQHIKNTIYNPDNIDVRLQHFILGHIIQMIEDNKLIIDDDMRDSIVSWTRKQKSLFIESLLIKLPISNMYFDGSRSPWKIIDGFQRLSAIYEFTQNKFRLESLEYLNEECEDHFFNDLPGYLQARVFETKIMAYIINPGTKEDVAYNIFRRISETGSHLNGQEIRNAFFHRQAGKFVKELAELSLFCELKKGRLTSKHMEDREYINRFISFLYLSIEDKYNGNMDNFLFQGMAELDKKGDSELIATKNFFSATLQRSRHLFGEYIFRCPLLDNKWSKKWDKSIYDMCMYCIRKLNDYEMEKLISCKDDFLNEFTQIFKKKGDNNSLTESSNNSQKDVLERFALFNNLLKKYCKL